MTKKKSEPKEEETINESVVNIPKAVLFEFENIAIGGRKVAYDVIKNVLLDKKIKISPVMFSRYYVDSSIPAFLEEAMKDTKTRASQEKLAKEITEGIRLSLVDNSKKASAGLNEILKKAKAEGVSVGALGGMDDDTIGKMTDKLNLSGNGLTVLSYNSDERNAPSPDAWLRLAKELSVRAISCVVVATSAASGKAALSAGMRCVIVPDDYTSYQDFGGADYVEENLDQDAVGRILSLIEE